MKIAFNPSTVAALITPPNNKDITFDLRGRNIFARGVKFCGTDTNTWRDIKINNVSIDSNILDLRNGSNTTLTNTNGVVTINSTWRPVVDNLTSDSTTSSLSANLGRVLAGLINTLSTNISNLYALRDGSNATGRWRGGLACFDVRGTNYTPYNLNLGLELHFFRNTTNNLKDGGEYNGVFSFRQWASGSDWSGGKAHLLSFTDNGNIWHRTSSGDDSWGTWKKLAYSTDIPSSLKSPYSLTTFGVVYDGSVAKTVTTSNFISLVTEGTSTITDGTMFITSYASNSGFADTNAVNVPYKRKAIHLWEYIKAKTDSLYATKSHNHDDRYLKLTGGIMTGTINRRSGGSTISGRDHAIIRLTYAPGGSSWNPIACVDTETGTWTLGHLSSGDSDTNFHFCFSTNADYNAGNNNGNYVTLRNKVGTIALLSDIPSSLKNPHALTISLNGTSQGPYDGSAAKNINITPSSIGAATSGHNHDGRYVYNYGATKMDGASTNKNALGMANNSGITGDWWYILQAAWNGEYRWNSLIAFPTLNRNGMYYRSGLDDNTKWGSWVKLLDVNNYSSTLDSRYYTESEVNNLLNTKLNRQNLSYGTWNPRGYNLAADYSYNGGDLSISESGGLIHVSVDGYFWLNEGLYRVLDTSDVAGLKNNLTVHLYLSNTDTTWWPLIWGGSSHNNTSDSTGTIYKSHNVLSWLTSSLTLYATNIQTNNIKNLSVGGGIYWNPYVESTTDGSDAASITLVRLGVAGGTTLVLSLMDNANDTILFQTNSSARLYHNSYPILTTLNTYVNNNKGYIYGNEITLVNNADTVDGYHASGLFRDLGWWAESETHDANDISGNGAVFAYTTHSNVPTTGVLVTFKGDRVNGNSYNWQISKSYFNNGLFTRQRNGDNGTWSNWIRLLDESDLTWNNIAGKPNTFTPAEHSHTVFKNNLMIKGTNGLSDSASIHLGIGDSDTGFKWISDGKCLIYANNTAVGEWTSGGMNWFTNPTVNGNKIWNAGNDGSGSGLDADTVDGYHASKFPYINNNGIWRIYGNAAVAALADNTAGLSSWAFGESRNYGITYLGILKPSTDTCGINAHGTIAVFGQGDTHLGIASDYGLANLQVFGGNADKIVWRKKVAFTDSNVASATKLQTSRSIWGHSFNGTADINGTIYINNSNSSEGAIRLNNNVNSNARISAIDSQVIFNTDAAIRFGGTSWDWNVWAGLKYNHTAKTIYLGLADGSVFNANSALSGGSLRFPGISNVYATTFNGSLSGNASSATNADKVDGYHASGLWRSDGATWNPGANISLNASANNQEWSFDITRNGYTGCYWHVWDSARSTMLKVNADNGKVYAPYNFVGNLEGSATKLQTPRSIWGQSFDGTSNINGLLTHIISSDDLFLNVHDNRTTSGFLAIRYFRNNSGVAALHWFHDKYGGYNWNNNCLNLDPYAGGCVTLGRWDNPDLTVIRGGNIGIGTTTPEHRLDVAGNIRATGQLYLPTNGNYNAILMGDDCWMGDCNIGDVIGLSGRGNANAGGIKFGKGGMYIGYNGSNHYSSGTSLWSNFNADLLDGYHADNIQSAGWRNLYRTGGSSNVIKWTRIGRCITNANDNAQNDGMIEFHTNGDQNYKYFGYGRLQISQYGQSSRSLMLQSFTSEGIHFYATIDEDNYIWLGHNAWWSGNSAYRVIWSGSYIEWYSSGMSMQTTNPNSVYVTDNGTFKKPNETGFVCLNNVYVEASKLKTARTLWYRNTFDGTNDVNGVLCINNSNASGNFDEGIRILNKKNGWVSITMCGTDAGDSLNGTSNNTWAICNENGNFYITKRGSSSGQMLLGMTSNKFRIAIEDSLNGGIASSLVNYSNNSPYGLLTRIYNTGVVSLQSLRESNNGELFGLSLQPLGGNVGIGTTSPTLKLDVVGNIRATGNSYATHFYESSDKVLKKNIKSILSSTNIPKIREFDWKDTGEHSYGFIALELEELGYGCLVSGANGKKTVNYTATLALTVAKLLNLINIQNKKISNLTKELKALKYGRKKNS